LNHQMRESLFQLTRSFVDETSPDKLPTDVNRRRVAPVNQVCVLVNASCNHHSDIQDKTQLAKP
jgi:hypothetical protein